MDQESNRIIGEGRVDVGCKEHGGCAAKVEVPKDRWRRVEMALTGNMKRGPVANQITPPIERIPFRLNCIELAVREAPASNVQVHRTTRWLERKHHVVWCEVRIELVVDS